MDRLHGVTRHWRILLVVAAGLAAVAFLPAGAYREVTQELVGLFGLMMAAVVPAMVLTASALRAGNLSVKRLVAYQNALLTQLRVWIGLFVIAFSASLLVVVGKMMAWSLGVIGSSGFEFDLIRILNGLLTACLALLVIRAAAVGRGVVSLLRLSAEIAIGEAELRDEERHRAADAAVARLPERPGFGDYVDLQH